MLEPAVAVAPPEPPPMTKTRTGGSVVDPVGSALHPAVEPAPAQLEEILGQIAVDRRRRAELDLAGVVSERSPCVHGAEDQPLPARARRRDRPT